MSTRGREDTAELLDELYKSSVLYGLSLVMAAVIQTLQGQLDLYHAIFVMQITFSLNIVYTYGMVRIRSTMLIENIDGMGS
jgi:hypothetical protein